jgi:hypothetical protein
MAIGESGSAGSSSTSFGNEGFGARTCAALVASMELEQTGARAEKRDRCQR